MYTASAAVVLMLVAHLLLRYDRTKRLALFFFLVYQPLNLATAFGFLVAVIDAIPHATNLKEYLLISIVVVPLSIVLSQISNDLGDTIHLLRFQRTRTTIEQDSIKGAFFLGLGLSVGRYVRVQRQLEKVKPAANEWVLLFWLRLALRVSLAWRSFWSRAAKITSSLPASLSAGVM